MDGSAKPIHGRPPPGRVFRRQARRIKDPRGQIHQTRELRRQIREPRGRIWSWRWWRQWIRLWGRRIEAGPPRRRSAVPASWGGGTGEAGMPRRRTRAAQGPARWLLAPAPAGTCPPPHARRRRTPRRPPHATTTKNLFRGGQKGFSEAGIATASVLPSRLIVILTEAVVLPASVNQKKGKSPASPSRAHRAHPS